jgi:hypothetical protein
LIVPVSAWFSMRMTMMRWHDDDHSTEPDTSRKPPRADETERRLQELKRLAREAELARQLQTKDQKKGKG